MSDINLSLSIDQADFKKAEAKLDELLTPDFDFSDIDTALNQLDFAIEDVELNADISTLQSQLDSIDDVDIDANVEGTEQVDELIASANEVSDKEVTITAEADSGEIDELNNKLDEVSEDVLVNVDTDDANSSIDSLSSSFLAMFGIVSSGTTDKIKGLIDSIKNVGSTGANSFNLLSTGVGSSNKALNVFKIALASTGVGALVVGLGSLVTFFTKTQRGADLLAQATDALGATFSVIIDRVSAFGEIIFNAISNPQKAIKDFGSLLKQFVLDRVQDITKSFGLLGKSLSQLFEGEFTDAFNTAGEALSTLGNGFNPLVEGFKSVTDEIANEASAAALLRKEQQQLEDQEISLITTQAKRRAEIEKLRLVAEDETLSAGERVEALEKANNLALKIFDDEKRIAVERARILGEQVALGESSREEIEELERVRARVIQLDGEEASLKKRLQTRLNSLIRERNRDSEASAKQVSAIELLNAKIKDLRANLDEAVFKDNTKDIETYSNALKEAESQLADFQIKLNLLGKDLTQISDLSSELDFSNFDIEINPVIAPKVDLKPAQDQFDEFSVKDSINQILLDFSDLPNNLFTSEFYSNTSDQFGELSAAIGEYTEQTGLNLENLKEFGIESTTSLAEAFSKSFEVIEFLTDNEKQNFEDYASTVASASGALADSLEEGTALQKAAAITESIINSYLAFTQVLKDEKLPTLVKIPLAGVILASGLAQVNKIRGAETGVIGIDKDYDGKVGKTDKIPLMVAKGESVISEKGTRLNYKELELANRGVNLKEHFKNQSNIDLTPTNGILKEINRKVGNTKINIYNNSGSRLKTRVFR